MRFHVLAVPHTVTCKQYSACAFTQKVLKFCTMMTRRGHECFHYGHEDSTVHAEKINIMNNSILDACYGSYDWRAQGFKHDTNDAVSKAFNSRAILEVGLRKKPGDFLLLFWGIGHQPVGEAHKDLIVVEPGIGSFNKLVAPFCIFESYAVMHHVYAKYSLMPRFNDAVVPNYFDPDDFYDSSKPLPDIEAEPGSVLDRIKSLEPGYAVLIGRVIPVKGIQIAIDMCKLSKIKLVIAGQGKLQDAVSKGYVIDEREPSEALGVTHIGYVEPRERALLLAKAKCLVMPTLYSEPFGGTNVEAQMSGVPVITTDWGAFTETVLHGVTGYRCRTMDQFLWAIRNCCDLNKSNIRRIAIANYGLTKVATMYEECFGYMSSTALGRLPYSQNEGRMGLKWLERTC